KLIETTIQRRQARKKLAPARKGWEIVKHYFGAPEARHSLRCNRWSSFLCSDDQVFHASGFVVPALQPYWLQITGCCAPQVKQYIRFIFAHFRGADFNNGNPRPGVEEILVSLPELIRIMSVSHGYELIFGMVVHY